jgi:hypothetical protein
VQPAGTLIAQALAGPVSRGGNRAAPGAARNRIDLQPIDRHG